jgi:limonene-1,2-epoxide hydrolase
MTTNAALEVVRDYHRAWTARDFQAARRQLADDLRVEVPINEYRDADEFHEALTGFGRLVSNVDLIAEFGSGSEAMLLYDMTVDSLGTMRIAEHFTVEGGRIARLRQIHDTADLRAAGFGAPA